MASRAQKRVDAELENGPVDPGHDAFVRAKVEKGLAQSRDRAAMLPIEQVWRDLAR